MGVVMGVANFTTPIDGPPLQIGTAPQPTCYNYMRPLLNPIQITAEIAVLRELSFNLQRGLGVPIAHLLALNAFSFCTKNFSRASALLQKSESLAL